MSSKPRVALIGCGPSGMSMLAAFSRAAENKKDEESFPEIVCYEKQETIGGLWNYTWRTGTDVFGECLHNGMYRYLWSNGPKECAEMGDYTFEEHFGKLIPSYPPREVLFDYLLGKAKHFNISKYNIRCNTVVRYVEEKGEQFLVTSQNLETQISSRELFDYVVVATGHFSVPFVPIYPGIEKFDGQILHGHDFRNAAEYKNKTLLIIGNGYSGEDIALQSYKYGAKECIISYRTKSTEFKWPDGVREIPQLVKFENGLFHFKDGSSCSADVLIFCTGYLNHYPFLPDNIRLRTGNCYYPEHLYKGVVYENNPRVLYIGSQDQYYTYTLFDVQAYWARDYILGKIDRKSKAERVEDTKIWRNKSLNLKTAYDEIYFQFDYMRDLMKDTDYPEHGHEERLKLWKQWKKHRADNILTYRDQAFTSTITGNTAPVYPIPWIEAMDDSLEGFLSVADSVNLE